MIEWRMNTVQSTSQPPEWTNWRELDLSHAKISNITKSLARKSVYTYEYRVGGKNGKYFCTMEGELFKIIEQEIMWLQLND